jgi:DNA-binding HxlR family transcriptional regulator
MASMNGKRRSGCPIAFGLDVFGDRWSLLVLRDMIFEGKSRFQDFLGSDERISTNILASRLEQLACAGLIEKVADPDDGRRFAYAPTSKGLDLIPLLLEFVQWSGKHDAWTEAPPEFVQLLEQDRDGVIAMVRGRFTQPGMVPPAMFQRPARPKAKPRKRNTRT